MILSDFDGSLFSEKIFYLKPGPAKTIENKSILKILSNVPIV